MLRRYFDWAATGLPDPAAGHDPVDPRSWGNPSSRHAEGRAAREALDEARTRCAAVLGVPSETLRFVSGGTEADALVLFSLLNRPAGTGLVVSAAEHAAVLENARALARLGRPVAILNPGSEGAMAPETPSAALRERSELRMAAFMAVNNETGSITDMASLTKAAREAAGSRGASLHVHCDAVQALGKIPLDLAAWDVDSAAFSGHKLGAPRGIGLLYLRKRLEPLVVGGGQEGGVRPGTENVAGAIALAAALERHASPSLVLERRKRAKDLCGRLYRGLARNGRFKTVPACRTIDDERFSPWILQAAFEGVPGEVLVRALDDAGFAISTGSACSSGSARRPVLEAMGVDGTTAFEAVRFSLGPTTTEEDVDALLEAVAAVLETL